MHDEKPLHPMTIKCIMHANQGDLVRVIPRPTDDAFDIIINNNYIDKCSLALAKEIREKVLNNA